jgi:hypothetical protein
MADSIVPHMPAVGHDEPPELRRMLERVQLTWLAPPGHPNHQLALELMTGNLPLERCRHILLAAHQVEGHA